MLGAAFRHKAFGIVPHLIGAVVVTCMIFWLAGTLRRRYPDRAPSLRTAAQWRTACVDRASQLLLGGAAYWARLYGQTFPQPIPVTITFTVMHTVTGAIMVLASTVLVTLGVLSPRCRARAPSKRRSQAKRRSVARPPQGMTAEQRMIPMPQSEYCANPMSSIGNQPQS